MSDEGKIWLRYFQLTAILELEVSAGPGGHGEEVRETQINGTDGLDTTGSGYLTMSDSESIIFKFIFRLSHESPGPGRDWAP